MTNRLLTITVILSLCCALVAQTMPRVEGITIGMTTDQVVQHLGKKYKFVDTIGKSAIAGQDFGLIYGSGDNAIEIMFTFGRVSSVEGYHFTDTKGRIFGRGVPKSQLVKALGKAKDSGPNSLLYLFGSRRLIIDFELDRVASFALE